MADDTSRRADFWQGVKDSFPLMAAVTPFSLLFGATAIQQDFTLLEAVIASATVFAGASQFVFIEIYGQNIPAWFAILAVFGVNFRHILYSASIGRWMHHFPPMQRGIAFFFMTDLQWAASEQRVHASPPLRLSAAWYYGFGLPLYVLWVAATAIGAAFGALIEQPERYGFDFLVPIYFLIILIGFRKRTNFVPVVGVSASAAVLALLTVGDPWHIPAGSLTGIAFAAALPPRHPGSGRPQDRMVADG